MAAKALLILTGGMGEVLAAMVGLGLITGIIFLIVGIKTFVEEKRRQNR